MFIVLSFIASAVVVAHDRITTKVTWDREIAPIVQARCLSCHRSGGRGPMPLTTYEEARPWAKAIKEEVLARRMPRWRVVRGYGDFTNDPSLSAFEIALIAAWADGGAPASAKASASVRRTADTLGSTVAASTARVDEPSTRSSELPCSAGRLPTGLLLGLRPTLDAGGSVQLTLRQANGDEQPLLWVKDFDPGFAETYWLRNPVHVGRGTRLRATASHACRLTTLLAAGTKK